MIIRPETPVADIAAALPSSIRVFQRVGIDFCCGGRKPLAVACEEQGLSYAEVTQAITDASAGPAGDLRDWNQESLTSLTEFIVERYHERLSDDLPRLQEMASRVREAHAAHAPQLVTRLDEVLAALAGELDTHMQQEETLVFPAIRRMESAASAHAGETPRLDAPIQLLEQEHDRAGNLLAELRTLTEGYIAPEWACRTFRGLYHGLEELERDMHVHVHLENNVLFPRALQLAGAR